jgi:hypothetical protein
VAAKSKRGRRQHVQQELFRRGGKRKGAGRKPKGARAGERHEARPDVKPYHALHIVMRVEPVVGSLRRRSMYRASPTRAHRAISYVLCNWRKHGEDRNGLPSTWLVDPFSSGISFSGWLELGDKESMWPIRETYDPLMVYRPTTWLLREGWKLIGTISARDVPGTGH